jgi:quercetin dioxygenase-like cupin family protein
MPKPGMYSKGPRSSLAAALLVGLLLSLQTSAADTVRQRTQSTALYPAVRNILSTGTTVTGEPIRYPSGAPALITAVEITLQPGQQTGWHTHPVPLLGYILEGELTVDYGLQGERVYRQGDALAEAMNEAHNGRNTGQNPVRILAVFIGMEGVKTRFRRRLPNADIQLRSGCILGLLPLPLSDVRTGRGLGS